MRRAAEMLELIITTAQEDPRIRAAMLNGSRANPNARRDFFQDFDVVYFVTEQAPFIHNLEWIRRFGELMILQLPDEMSDPPPEEGSAYGYLMQFADGNRIDLGIVPVEKVAEYRDDSQTIVLLDKDGLLDGVPPASDRAYLPKPPTAKQYADCCNEFWWVSPYVAKGLWREEFVYARQTLDLYVREQLVKMLTWYIGVRTGFTKNPGKFGKHFQQYLEPEMWELLLQTYADASSEHTWEALLAMGDLFRRAATVVGEHFRYMYPMGDDRRVSAHLRHVRSLPKDAEEMY